MHWRRLMEQELSLPLKHWGFQRWPFRGTPAAEQFYPTAGNGEALARIEYLVESRRRLGALLGEAGMGKSLVLQAAARKLSRQGRAVALVDVAGASTREFLWSVAAGWPLRLQRIRQRPVVAADRGPRQ